MFVIWFKKNGDYHWIEIFLNETAEIVRSALIQQGYEVADTSFDPRKYSLINQQKGN